jgi:hypothetical protein
VKYAGWIVAGVVALTLLIVVVKSSDEGEAVPAGPTVPMYTFSPSPQTLFEYRDDPEGCTAIGGTYIDDGYNSRCEV